MIHDFRIHRVSRVGGELAQQLTKAAKSWLKKNQSKYDEKIKAKLNKTFQKKKEKLVFEMESYLGGIMKGKFPDRIC